MCVHGHVSPTFAFVLIPRRQIVYCIWLVFETVVVYFFIVETKGKTLEETAALFDGTEGVIYDAAANATARIVMDLRQDEYVEKSSTSSTLR